MSTETITAPDSSAAPITSAQSSGEAAAPPVTVVDLQARLEGFLEEGEALKLNTRTGSSSIATYFVPLVNGHGTKTHLCVLCKDKANARVSVLNFDKKKSKQQVPQQEREATL